jgi:hypothetical protein
VSGNNFCVTVAVLWTIAILYALPVSIYFDIFEGLDLFEIALDINGSKMYLFELLSYFSPNGVQTNASCPATQSAFWKDMQM